MDTPTAAGAPEPPELTESDYIRQVFLLPDLEARVSLEADLLAKAASWDIPLPDPIYVVPPHDQKRNTSSAESQGSTVATFQSRTFSSASDDSASTAPTSRSAPEDLHGPLDLHGSPSPSKPRTPTFRHYDRYLARLERNPSRRQADYLESQTPASPAGSVQSLFSAGSKKDYFGIMNGMRRIRWGKRRSIDLNSPSACTSCREKFTKPSGQHVLPCHHWYCSECLKRLVRKAMTDESKFPPQCCTQPIPGSALKVVLSREDARAFLKAAQQFSTPCEMTVLCPNPACGGFIPRPRPGRADSGRKPPRDVVCPECETRVCFACKNHTHAPGEACREYRELERRLVEEEGGQHGESEEAKGPRQVLIEGNTEIAQAEKRLLEHGEFSRLRRDLVDQRRRFGTFKMQKRTEMTKRHEEERRGVTAKHADQAEEMRERHTKAATQLEERQVEAEMEMRATLEKEERSVLIRLRHMEAYCDRLGRSPESSLPPRAVTERDLRELGQQYNLRDRMARLHESKINVLREKQAKRMEDLMVRQEEELDQFERDKGRELETLAATVATEEDALGRVFRQRKLELQRLWQVRFDILRKALEQKDGVAYGSFDVAAAWSEGDEADDDASSLLRDEATSDPSWQPSKHWLSLL